MDPDAEAMQAASQILRATLITVAFTACNYSKTKTPFSSFSPPVADSFSKQNPLPAKKTKKTIYLTFDDGPNKGTKKVMDIVNDEEVPVTVFVIGEHVYGSKAQGIIFDSLLCNRFFEIANHSYTHAFHNKFSKFYAVPDTVVKDFIRCADSLNLTTHIIRTPGRNIWRTKNTSSTDIKESEAAADSLRQHSFAVLGWDLEWHFDNKLNLKNTSDDMINQIDSIFIKGKTKTPNHLVLLAHDQVYEKSRDSGELHQFIKKLKAKNDYYFETVSKYPGL